MITALLIVAYLLAGTLFMLRAKATMKAHNIRFREKSSAHLWVIVVTVFWPLLWAFVLACRALDYRDDRR